MGFLQTWVEFRVEVAGRPTFIARAGDPNVVAEHLLEYVLYACFVVGVQRTTIILHLSFVNFSVV